jgi:hypothetical protein
LRSRTSPVDPSVVVSYLAGLGSFVAAWIVNRILDKVASKVKPRHAIGSVAFGTGVPGFSVGVWALWTIFRYEVPVAIGLFGKYPQGVLVYLGSQLFVWSMPPIIGVLLVALGIVAFFPDSPQSAWISRHFPLMKRSRRELDRISHWP